MILVHREIDMSFKRSLSALALAAAFGPALAASAQYSLSIVDPAAGLGTGPWGTVTLTENGADVDFSILLDPTASLNPVDTGSHVYFAFMAKDVVLSDIVNMTAADLKGKTLSAVATPTNAPFGDFNFGIQCGTGCGGNNEIADPLSFTVKSSSLADFGVGNASNLSSGPDGYKAYFSADIRNTDTGKTGVVGAVAVVPEPEAYGLALAGMLVVGFAMRRRA